LGYTKKTNPGASTTSSIAGDQFNKILDIITGITATDTTDEWNIKTPTRFGDSSFRLWHLGGTSFAYRFRTSTLTASQDVILPPLTAADTIVFLALGQTLTNKVVSVVDNSIVATGAASGDLLTNNGTKYVNFPKGAALQIPRVNAAGTALEWFDMPTGLEVAGGIALGGTAQFSGDASNKVFTIDHGLSDPPDIYFAIPVSTDAQGDPTVTVDSTNITVTYPMAPPTGINNVKLVWGSGYSDVAVSGFSPTTTNTLQNKTMSGTLNSFSNIPITAISSFVITSPTDNQALTYDTATGKWINESISGVSNNPATYSEISTPANQSNTDDILIYDKAIDTNNNALFAKYKENNVIVEVRIF
jgi:hypothetical protein